MNNKLLIAVVLCFGMLFADTALDVNINGLYSIYEVTVNVGTNPVLVTPSISWYSTPNTIIQPLLADAVIVVPQVVSDDVWFSTNVVGNGISKNVISTTNVVVWTPVGEMFRETDYRKNILYPSGGAYGINGVVLKKTTGSCVVGVRFLAKPQQ